MTRKHLRWIAFLGTSAPVVYVGATAAGSLLDREYSQLRHHVSDLTATGAPTWAALAPVYVGYNVLVAALGLALYRSSPHRLFGIGAALLGLNALAGVLSVTALRQDPGGLPTTPAGAGHIVAAGVMVVTIVSACFVYGFAFRRHELWRPMGRFSFAIGAGLLIVGPLGVAAADTELAGLAERGPIGLFLVWLAGVGGFALRHHSTAPMRRKQPL
jgi:hypothetical protein